MCVACCCGSMAAGALLAAARGFAARAATCRFAATAVARRFANGPQMCHPLIDEIENAAPALMITTMNTSTIEYHRRVDIRRAS